MKASTTAWPPLVVTGLLMLLLGTSTDIPFSTRMPLVSFEFFTVILYNIVSSFSLRPQVPPRQAFHSFCYHKKSVRLDSVKPSACRYRQTPFTERIEETYIPRSFLINQVLAPIDFKTKVSISPSSPVWFGEFYRQELRMPSLLKPRFLPRISPANIVIFQTNAQFVGIFSSNAFS